MTSDNRGQGLDNSQSVSYDANSEGQTQFDEYLGRCFGSSIQSVETENNGIVTLKYTLNGESKALFLFPSQIIAACQYVMNTYFKSPLETCKGLDTYHKTLC